MQLGKGTRCVVTQERIPVGQILKVKLPAHIFTSPILRKHSCNNNLLFAVLSSCIKSQSHDPIHCKAWRRAKSLRSAAVVKHVTAAKKQEEDAFLPNSIPGPAPTVMKLRKTVHYVPPE
jgi:hypothetical protein